MRVVEAIIKNKEITFKDIVLGSTFRLPRDKQVQIKVLYDPQRHSTLGTYYYAACLETGVLTYFNLDDIVIPVTCEVHVLPEESSRTISIGNWASTEPRRKFT